MQVEDNMHAITTNNMIKEAWSSRVRLLTLALILAIGAASEATGDWRLNGATLYVTKEPCVMCAGAIQLSRVTTVVFGAYDTERGALGSAWDLAADDKLHHRPEVVGGVMEAECAGRLLEFFRKRRAESKK